MALQWQEGYKDLGCAFHKTARFSDESVTGQVDVFVMPRLAKTRPIAVTVKVGSERASTQIVQESVSSPVEASALRDVLGARLSSFGVHGASVESLVEGIVLLIEGHAVQIDQALKGQSES